MQSKNYNASNNWTYTVRQTVTVDWLSFSMILDPDPYREAREVIERIKSL